MSENTTRSRVTNQQADGAECPYCGSTETSLENAFGSTILKSQYHCDECMNVFEHIKWET
ncbi:hypothetical protein EA462_13950 [Natrarchaeobius halalkaliphilus]|uniref:PaaD zinc beta ribbon domain-containing protein n=1 Tax=Natrarchaeobius halalkaliphilus TaxID=1679091 RepID=A0A3N6LJ93_9EURY|nr:hypothetical protein EA462_13950 [Natrarchaeobius halalkaliphilus]